MCVFGFKSVVQIACHLDFTVTLWSDNNIFCGDVDIFGEPLMMFMTPKHGYFLRNYRK